jgi:hypothetical protein
MTFEEFDRRAHALWESIPEELLGGVEYLAVERRTVRHPGLRDVYTLGECATGELDLGDDLATPTRSGIHLYWGSFRQLARDEAEFDWEGELWETLTHELRHHRESGAGEDALEDFDYAADENFKRREGLPFDPLFFRMGEDAGGGWREVDGDRFLEVAFRVEPEDPIRVELEERQLELSRPERPGDVHYLYLDELSDTLDTAVVLVRRQGLWSRLRRVFSAPAPLVMETTAAWREASPLQGD